jgi:hypothetical protein
MQCKVCYSIEDYREITRVFVAIVSVGGFRTFLRRGRNIQISRKRDGSKKRRYPA